MKRSKNFLSPNLGISNLKSLNKNSKTSCMKFNDCVGQLDASLPPFEAKRLKLKFAELEVCLNLHKLIASLRHARRDELIQPKQQTLNKPLSDVEVGHIHSEEAMKEETHACELALKEKSPAINSITNKKIRKSMGFHSYR